MERKHTPGPWQLKKARTLLHIGAASPVCEISISANHVHEDYPGCKRDYVSRQEANARLINAAPDLLAACEQAKAYLKPELNEPGRTVFWNLVAALAKATGKAAL